MVLTQGSPALFNPRATSWVQSHRRGNQFARRSWNNAVFSVSLELRVAVNDTHRREDADHVHDVQRQQGRIQETSVFDTFSLLISAILKCFDRFNSCSQGKGPIVAVCPWRTLLTNRELCCTRPPRWNWNTLFELFDFNPGGGWSARQLFWPVVSVDIVLRHMQVSLTAVKMNSYSHSLLEWWVLLLFFCYFGLSSSVSLSLWAQIVSPKLLSASWMVKYVFFFLHDFIFKMLSFV